MICGLRHSFDTVKRLLFRFDEFKCTLPLSGSLEFVVYERPGLWCNQNEIDQMVHDMREVARAGQSGKDIPWYGPLEGRREDLNNRIISIAYDRRANRPVGFSAQSYLALKEGHFEIEVVHLGLIYVDPNQQGKSISYVLALLPNILILLKSGLRDTWVSSVSQVPAVVGLVATNYSDVYPSHQESAKQSFMHRKLSQLIMERQRHVFGVGPDADFDIDTQVIRNAYTGGSDNMKKSYPDAQKHRLDQVNAMCLNGLDYERGDDFLQLGKLGWNTITGIFQSQMKKMGRAKILLNLILILTVTSLLPLIRWVVPKGTAISARRSDLGVRSNV